MSYPKTMAVNGNYDNNNNHKKGGYNNYHQQNHHNQQQYKQQQQQQQKAPSQQQQQQKGSSSSSSSKAKQPKKMPRYSAETVIGSGAFGVVYKAVYLATQKTVAIKKVREDPRYKNRELAIMKIVKHPNIVTLLDCFYSKIQRDIYLNLVMEYSPETLYVTIRN
eukprot:191462_1